MLTSTFKQQRLFDEEIRIYCRTFMIQICNALSKPPGAPSPGYKSQMEMENSFLSDFSSSQNKNGSAGELF